MSPPAAINLAVAAREILEEAAQLTRTSARRALTIVVYPSFDDIRSASCMSAWGAGLFDGSVRLAAPNGRLSRATVRHELMHAQVSPLMPRYPRWFGEGLAGYFEQPSETRQPRPSELMDGRRAPVPFGQIRSNFLQPNIHEARAAYAQSELMLHWLVAERGEPVISYAVEYLSRGGDPAWLLAYLDPSLSLRPDALEAWIKKPKP